MCKKFVMDDLASILSSPLSVLVLVITSLMLAVVIICMIHVCYRFFKYWVGHVFQPADRKTSLLAPCANQVVPSPLLHQNCLL